MSVNVGTIGHVDNKARKVAIVGTRPNLSSALAIALTPGIYSQLPSLPAPKPAKRMTAADLDRIEAAEAKRQRRIERNKQRGDV